jgi:hypothetical protein
MPSISEAGTLSATYVQLPTNSTVNLTAQGPLDWVHWGFNTEFGYDRRAVAPTPMTVLPPTIAPSGSGPYQYADNFNGYSWTDGTPNTFATNTTTGIYVLGKNNGFQLVAPADTVTRRLEVYVGAFAAQGQFSAALSDKSAPAYSDLSVDNNTNGPSSAYTLIYAADSPAQTLSVTFVLQQPHNPFGNVTLQAAALSYAFSNNPPTATLTSPPANSTFSAPANVPLAALASDSDGTVSKVEFFQGTTKLGQATNSNYAFVWRNAPAGDFLLRAVATDNGGLSYTSKPVEIFINTNGGVLSGSVTSVTPELDLTAAGNLDWAHWGFGSSDAFDHKSGVLPQISNFSPVGTNVVRQLSGYPIIFDWSDGTPTASGGTDTGVFIIGLGNGFELTVPAASTMKTLTLSLGLFSGQGTLQAFLSNFSAPAYTDTSLSSLYGDAAGAYTFNFSAAAPNQTLHVRFTGQTLYDLNFGNVTLEAASLSGYVPPPPPLLNPAWASSGFAFSFNTETNRTYTIAYRDSLSTGVWQYLTNVPGDGTMTRITNFPAPWGSRFYHVLSP